MDSEHRSLTAFLSSPTFIKVVVAAPPALAPTTPRESERKPYDQELELGAASGVLHPIPGASGTSSAGRLTTVFYVHEGLLASRSPELYKCVSSDMKDGPEGVLVLHDVEELVVERFLTWVYRNEYTQQDELRLWPNYKDFLMFNVKVYIFAGRFNIKVLQQLVMAKVNEALSGCRSWDLFSLYPELIDIILHAFNNLPTSDLFTTPEETEARNSIADPPSSRAGGDEMLRFWIQLLAWKLPTFQSQTRYEELIKNQDICRALLQRGVLDQLSKQPPWVVPTGDAMPAMEVESDDGLDSVCYESEFGEYEE